MPEPLSFLVRVEDACANRVERSAWGKALFHTGLEPVWDLNFLRVEHGEPSAAELAAEAERLQAPTLRHRRVNVDDEALGEQLAPAFQVLGWEVQRHLVMEHRRPPERAPVDSDVRETDRETLVPIWEAGIRSEPWNPTEATVHALVAHKGVIAAAVPTRYFAAYADGEPVSYCELYSSGGIGQIEAVLTLLRHRGRGLASAVVLAALAASKAAGNRLTFLLADEDDWPKELYARLGFDRSGRRFRFLRRPA